MMITNLTMTIVHTVPFHKSHFTTTLLCCLLVFGCAPASQRVSAAGPSTAVAVSAVQLPQEVPSGVLQAQSPLIRTDTLDPEMAGILIHTISAVSEPLERPMTGASVRVVSLFVTTELGGVMLSQGHAFIPILLDSQMPVSLKVSGLDTSLATMSAEYLLTGKVGTTEPGQPLPSIWVKLAPAEGKTWGSASTAEQDLVLTIAEDK